MANIAYTLSHRALLPAYFNQIQVTGQADLPQNGAVIFAPTHRSRWDALLVPYAVGPQVIGRYPRYMVTADEMQGLQGWFIRRLGGFAVDTRSPGISSLRYGIDLLHHHQALVIFPEGGQLLANRRAGVNRLHPGLARIAVKASLTQPNCDVKIVPIAVNYSDPLVGRCDVDIQIGQPLVVSDYLETNGKRSARRITQDLATAMRHLSHLPDPLVV
ncbi:1-acyl-sn-glycerol-3-phosphate acyltransferase [filamentous cyanobacterium LEGE 11480]|uniref:1-acyl-sn-glycerol-3-phosphate acyltransferase n=1 Tax=Romeriopsis navalis LEGE 11480 TaxID=2777977 RepID=A0A928VSW0_9CYAN|nr:1-acyl-sn-glycerol-3-phosphate acyltransferase [Romeriopsis navalis]MBE9031619.1 1-acyl-sn-glycerol-3-phosphate acyltransferase [Romeriopsis navalis LEGE 11480]